MLVAELALALASAAPVLVILAVLTGSIPVGLRPPLWWWRHTFRRAGNVRTAVAATATLVLGGAILAVLYAFVADQRIGFLGLDDRCSSTPLGCNVVTEVVVT